MNDPVLALLETARHARPVARGWLLLASRLAIAATCACWLVHGARLEALVGLTALALTWLPGVLVRDEALRGPVRALAAILLAAHVTLGMGLALYERSAMYDKWVHLLGFAAIATLILAATARYCARRQIAAPAAFVQLVVLAAALSLGTVWELFEFAVDRTGWFRAQRGLEDTMLDLVADLCGVLLVLATHATWLRRRVVPA